MLPNSQIIAFSNKDTAQEIAESINSKSGASKLPIKVIDLAVFDDGEVIIDSDPNRLLPKPADADPNEDFNCGNCGKEVADRILFCSVECSDEFDKKCMDVNDG